MFLVALSALAASQVDSYSLAKELNDIARHQHQNGGFFGLNRVATAHDTMHAVWLSNVFYLFPYFQHRPCFKWIGTLRNRDGGAAMSPGTKSSVYATYCFIQTARIIQPDLIDTPHILEFLRTHYDTQSGLFRNTLESEPSIEATFYAYEFFSQLADVDLSWLNTFTLRQYIQDHLVDNHFEFEGVDVFDAQLYAGSIAKFVSLTVPYKSISDFVASKLTESIKSEIELSKVYSGVRAMRVIGDEPIPAAVIQWMKLGSSLDDIFYTVAILVESGDISKFFEVEVRAINAEGATLDVEHEGVAVQQIIRPAIRVSALNRFIIIQHNVNVTIAIADETPYQEALQPQYETGFYTTQRLTSVSKLGSLSIGVLSYMPNPIGSPIIIQQQVHSHVSLPVDITCEAFVQSDEPIPQESVVAPGTNFKVTIEQVDSSVEVKSDTMTTLSVYDAAGSLLHHELASYPSEFAYQLPALALPAGSLKLRVDVGDSENGIHTQREFIYKIASEMTASEVVVPKSLKLTDVLNVAIVPGVNAGGEFVPFSSAATVENAKDAAGEPIYPPTAVDSHMYQMRVKCGGIVSKVVDGEVSSKDGKLFVTFESTVEESLDFATGFAVDFVFIAEDKVVVPLKTELYPVAVEASVVAVGGETLLKGGIVEYGNVIRGEVTLKNAKSSHTLEAGRAYPVLVIKRGDKIVSETKFNYVNGKFVVESLVGADIPSGESTVSLMIRKGSELVQVNTESGEEFTAQIQVRGTPEIKAEIVEKGKFVVVDFVTSFGGKKLGGAALEAQVITHDGQLAARIPLSQEAERSRMSWAREGKGGQYTIEVRRLNAEDEKPLLSLPIAIESSIMSWAHRLPLEGIAVAVAFAIFVWSIKLRTSLKTINQTR